MRSKAQRKRAIMVRAKPNSPPLPRRHGLLCEEKSTSRRALPTEGVRLRHSPRLWTRERVPRPLTRNPSLVMLRSNRVHCSCSICLVLSSANLSWRKVPVGHSHLYAGRPSKFWMVPLLFACVHIAWYLLKGLISEFIRLLLCANPPDHKRRSKAPWFSHRKSFAHEFQAARP